MLFAIALINALASVAFMIVSSFYENGIPVFIQMFITGLLAYIVPICVYAKVTGMTSKEASERFYLKKSKTHYIVLAALLGIGCQFIAVVLNLPMNMLFKNYDSYTASSISELVLAIVVVGVLPALFEEFLFRGIVLGSMSEINAKAAIIFSSVMFAILHADICGFLGYLFMGFTLSVVTRRTESVLAAVVFHFMNNVTALLLGYFNPIFMYEPKILIALFAGGVLLFAVVAILFVKITKRQDEAKRIPTGRLLAQNFVSVPIILTIVVTAFAGLVIRIV